MKNKKRLYPYILVITALETEKVEPMHYGTFAPLKDTPEQLKKSLAGFSTDVIVMQPGDVRAF